MHHDIPTIVRCKFIRKIMLYSQIMFMELIMICKQEHAQESRQKDSLTKRTLGKFVYLCTVQYVMSIYSININIY